MEYPGGDLDLSKADTLGLSMILDIKTEKELLEGVVDQMRSEKDLLDCVDAASDPNGGCIHQSSDLCRDLSPSSSECPFANLPLFGDECGLELSQDCSSSTCISDSLEFLSGKVSSKSWSDSDDVPVQFEKKRKKKLAARAERDKGSPKTEAVDLPHKCHICGKQFLYTSNLTSHVKRHGDKSYKCVECGKTFALSVNYEAHMRFHSGIKPYSCEVCGKSFSWSGGYHRHQRIHSGLKPYVCTDCGKEFSDIGNYNNHRRVHTGERPHVCTECGKGFSRSDSLNRHMITHSQVKMFECTQCGHEFKHLESLNKHCRRIHEVLKPLKRDECIKQNHRVIKLPKRVRTKE